MSEEPNSSDPLWDTGVSYTGPTAANGTLFGGRA